MKKLLTALLIPLLTLTVSADTEKKNQVTLETALAGARRYNPLFQKDYRALKSETELSKINMLRFFPGMQMKMKTGLVPEARGDYSDSPDSADELDGLGPFYKFEFKVSYPIYTFGRYTSAKKAAKLGINIDRAKTSYEREKYLMQVIKSYWSLAAAREATEMAREMKKNFDKLQKEVQERLLDEKSDITDSHLLELKTNAYNVSQIYRKALSSEEYAQKVLHEITGLAVDGTTDVGSEKIPPSSLKKDDMKLILSRVKRDHYQFRGMQDAAKAIRAKIKFTESTRLPILYLAGAYKYGIAPNRTDVSNPFLVDNYNYNSLGAYVGLKWDLNFMTVQKDLKKLECDYRMLDNEIKTATKKLMLDLHRAFSDVSDREALLKKCQASLKSSRTWLRLTLDNWEMGIGEPSPAIKAYRAYYELWASEIRMKYRLNISIAQLAFAMGDITYYTRWLKNEKITLK